MKSFSDLENKDRDKDIESIPEPKMIDEGPSKCFDEKYPIDRAIYWSFITNSALDKVIATEFVGNKSEKINVYIDLYQILVSVCRFTIIKNAYSISSAIINYCANIRRYFKRIGVYANIVLVYTTNESDNITKFIPGFESYYKNRIKANPRIKNLVDANVELLKALVPYLPNIFIRVGTVESALIIHDIVKRKLIGIAPSIVLSSSVYMMQLPLFSKSLRVIAKRSSAKYSEDRTYCFNKNNCFQAFLYENKGVNVIGAFNQNTLHILMSMNGISKLGVKSMGFNYETVLEFCRSIPYGYEHDLDVISRKYEEFVANNRRLRKRLEVGKIPNTELLINRIKGIDIMYQYSLYKLMPEYDELDFLNQYEDKESVHNINSKYYRDCEMNLEDL